MTSSRLPQTHYETTDEFLHDLRQAKRRKVKQQEESASPWSYRLKLGRGTIWLNSIEYRILTFLASRPYRAYTPRRIAAEVSTDSQPVPAESLGRHIISLRHKLGFFADYVQSVPHIGYRFKL